MRCNFALIAAATLTLVGCEQSLPPSSAPTLPLTPEAIAAALALPGDATARVATGLAPGRSGTGTGAVENRGVTIRFRGKFEPHLDLTKGSLPEASFPFPNLLGGRFQGVVTLPAGSTPVGGRGEYRYGADDYKYSRVAVEVIDATGEKVHDIGTGPNFFRRLDNHTLVSINMGPSVGQPGVPGDLRLNLEGFFTPHDGAPPTAAELNQASLRDGFVQIDAPSGTGYWVLDVSLVELRAETGADN